MADTQETITDIIAEKRRRADKIERDCAEAMKRGKMISDCCARELVADIRREADRLEAALRCEIVEVSTRAATFAINKTNEEWRQKLGDCAKLREAVKAVVDVGYPHNFQHEAPHISGYCYDITRAIYKCFTALAAPPRNCDIYLTEEAVDAAAATVRDCWACSRIDMEAPCVFCMVRWLLAPAKEGGRDGK